MTNQVLEVIQSRSSARAYSEEQLTKEELEAIVTAGLQAPTATNRQEIRFSVVNGSNPVLAELDADLRKSRGLGETPHTCFYEAPTVIFLSAEDEFHWGKLDAGIAVMSMSLAAESLGLGSLIIGCVLDNLRGEKKAYYDKALGIPEGYSFQIALAVGHREDEKEPHTYEWDDQVVEV